MQNLFKDRNFDETQKKVKCRVLINYKEIKEITLEEFIHFMKEIEEDKQCQHDIPVRFYYKKWTQKIRKTVISNGSELVNFITNLYFLYRKIETKMEKIEYPNILPDLDSKEIFLYNICAHLDTAKEEYRLVRKYDILKIYPILKKLFFCYIDYLKFSITHLIHMNEGDHLPGTVREIKSLLQNLDTWVPAMVKGKWINCTGSYIAIPPGFNKVIEALHNTTKLSYFPIVNDREAVEPYIVEEKNKILFGFINMTRTEQSPVTNNLNSFESECLEGCTKELRKWICTICGEFIKTQLNSAGQQFLFCSCGSQRYREKLLICHHPSHRSQELSEIQDKDGKSNLPLPDMERSHDQTLNPENPLSEIYQQLKKVQIKDKDDTDAKILNAIIHIAGNSNEEAIKNALKKLEHTNVDGDTQHLINSYLKVIDQN